MSTVVIFEVAGHVQQALQQPAFQVNGLIALDAYPYRTLKRGKQSVAVFVERTNDLVTVVALGRVLPGDLSGASNRNLEFDLCRTVRPGVLIPSDTEVHLELISGLRRRATLTPLKSDELLGVIAKSGEHAAREVECLLSQMEPKRVRGEAGFLLACEQDAVALSLKAANLHAQLSKLSTWSAGSPDPPLITGLKEAREPETFWSCPDHKVLWSQRNGVDFGWMRLARENNGSGLGVTLVNARPAGGQRPAGVTLVYFHPKFRALALLHYSSDRTFPEYVDEIDALYSSEGNPADPRLAPKPGFIKFAKTKDFETTKERLLGGTIHLATDLRNWEQWRHLQFRPQRHLSNSTFAALLGGGWLGARDAGYSQAREVIERVLETNHAAVIAVQGHWDAAMRRPPSDYSLF
ncbi:hypothetical protein ORV05_07800 [Amycolatopsis cynarae]|uniref:Uncharacterized protein n=1 Tax=Amycolatopsis cynarae TaxID=2995223 RepID=A0ABY7B8D9_9PSEU|nr:hypothetical protein [Amycolatopsis sp. HUAS 11-8]WAL67674.1 hypothetical protein ORV05_07800 [Amycolatopsis sp. HUAS 11-8]